MYEAARLTDPIAHTSALAGFLVGALIGIALIAAVAFATFTCGFGVALLAGAAAGLGATAILAIGEAIGKAFSSPAGAITSGSKNVFTNHLQAAFATASTVLCDKHNPVPLVAEGSASVWINSKPAARAKDAVTCGATIDSGSTNVFIGGGRERYMEVDDEIPPWLRTAVDVAFLLAGLVGGLAGLLKAAGGLTRATLPCAAKFIATFVAGEAAARYVVAPAISRALGGLMGHPVDVTTGRKVLLAENEVDVVVQSPMPLIVSRFYASNLDHEGSLGKGWVLPWDLRLQRRDGQLWFTDNQGRASGYPLLQPGHTAFSDTEQTYLACTLDGRYILYNLNELYYDFGQLDEGDRAAWVRRVEDRTGQWHAYTRDEHDQVVAIHTSGGQRMRLEYSALPRRLTKIACTGGGTPGALVEYGYDEFGQLIAVSDASGAVVRQFSYTGGLMASHTSALGLVCSYTWAEIGGQMRVAVARTSEGEHTTFTYDPARRQSWAVDEQGRRAHWTYDEFFQVVACTDLDGSQYAIEYSPAGMPLALHLPGERQVRFEYDGAARLIAETDPLGRVTRTAYDGNSMRISEMVLADGSSWRASYDYLGRLLQATDPLGRRTAFEYPPETSQMPLVRVDAHGGRQQMAWDRRGQLLAFTDCSGKTTRYDYDADGHVARVTDALGHATRYERTRLGQPRRITFADGSTVARSYDSAGLLIREAGPGPQVREYQRNARGQVTHAINPGQRHLRYVYDAQGKLVELASDPSTRYRFAYDAGDRLVSEMRPDGVERHVRYDAAGNVASIEHIGADPRQLAGERPRRSVLFEFDKMRRLLAQHTGTASTLYTRDDGDQLIAAARTPTPAGQALGVTASTIRFDYDLAGRMLAEHGSEGTVGYTFDALDNLLSLDLPHGQQLGFLAYGAGHVHQIRSGGRLVSDFERDDLHREIAHSQGSLVQRLGYDAAGRRSWQAAGPVQEALGAGQGRLWRSYRYHASGELAEQRDNVRGALGFDYDPAGRLTRKLRVEDHAQEKFAWDAVGNLLDEAGHSSRGQVAGNRLMVWQDLRFEYDAWGNLLSKRKGAHQVQGFVFDGEDRLLRVSTENLQGRTDTVYEYDAIGRRIVSRETRQLAGQRPYTEVKRFVWQGLRMVQEVRESGVSNYVYSPDDPYTPLAREDAVIAAAATAITAAKLSSRLYHFHTDLAGAPLEVTDEAGELAWAGTYSAWGKVAGGAEAAVLERIDQPLRYPGQYADSSTGLHYNTFRFYDPDIGRFISQDPIGLAGGDNLYAYAPNPTGWADPLGWCSTKLGKNMGARSGDGMGNHHLIPEELMKGQRFSQMFKRLKAMGFDGDAASNGHFLPGSEQLAKQTGLPGHWSSHDAYTAAIRADLDKLNAAMARGMSDSQLVMGISRIQAAARAGLENGRFAIDSITGRLL